MRTAKTLGFLRKTIGILLAAALMLALAISFFPVTAHAAGGLELSTAYPGISAKPGDSLSFTLNLENTSGAPLNASLSIADIPAGWSGYFSADGGDVNKVYVGGTGVASVTFYLSVPQDAATGTHMVSLVADAGDGAASQLDLELTVTEEVSGESNFTVQYPEQEGSAGTAFSFSATLVNNYAAEQSYSLSSQAPSGWSVSFTPSDGSSQVASLSIEPHQSQGLTIGVTPPASAEAGDYTISYSAVSANETLTGELTVTITEAYELVLSTPSGLLSFDAEANKESTVVLSVTNNSNVPLENINLSSSAPTDWEVRFETATIETLEAGATQEVTAYVKPASSAMSGDYVTNITASNSAASSTAQFRVSVKTSTLWGIFAILIIMAVVVGLLWIFRKYGRR